LQQGLQAAVLDLCEAYAIEVTEEKKEFLRLLDVPRLEQFRKDLKASKAWPER